MDKLIDLLNKYEEEICYWFWYTDYQYFKHNGRIQARDIDWEILDEDVIESMIISKKYEFIAWIVENKLFRPYQSFKDFMYQSRIEFDNWLQIVSVNGQLYDSILCWLALSDKPIETLLSILK